MGLIKKIVVRLQIVNQVGLVLINNVNRVKKYNQMMSKIDGKENKKIND